MGQGHGYNTSTWGQEHWTLTSTRGEWQRSREDKLRSLLACLKARHIDASRLAFTALIELDPNLSTHPILSQIGAALQSTNLSLGFELSKALRLQAIALDTSAQEFKANALKAKSLRKFIGKNSISAQRSRA